MAAAAAQLLGEDGRGYDLARRLEACGAWRAWLGDDAAHAELAQHLSSPATWDAFLSPAAGASSPPRPLLLLQLRVRALLFDKASVALLLSRGAGPHSVNVNYLQLHGDDIYFSLEREQDDNIQHQMHSRTAFSPSRDGSMLSQRRNRYDELSDNWYKQFAEKVRTWRSKSHSGDKEIPTRTPEGMSDYLKVCNVHKRKRAVFLESQSAPLLENGPSSTDETFIPEIIFPSDCVPESAIPRTSGISRTDTIEVHGVLDNLPAPVSRNTAMLERFGMMPEYYKTGNKYRGKDGSRVEGKSLSHEQALLMIQKLVVDFLKNLRFNSGTAASIDVLSEIIIKHICKLGRNLKLLTDSYRKQFSSIELLKMFLQTVGYSNIGPLMEITKMGNRVANHPLHQDAQVLQSPAQNSLLHAQQLQRQFPPQMTIHNQNLTPQQQHFVMQQQWRRTHMASPRGLLTMADKNQPLVNVKIENTMDSQTESALSQKQQLQARQQQLLQQQRQQLQQQQLQQQQQQLQLSQQQQHLQQQQQQLNQRQQQLNQQQEQHFQQQQQQQHFQQQQQQQQQQHQFQQQNFQQQQQQLQQQQQMAMSANQNAQLSQQFKQVSSMNAYGMRVPPVKVEAFHELVSGDSSLKQDNDPNKLTSPK